jgi:hypothetical protein
MTADDELDERLRARLRDHFEAAAAQHTAPPFETMLASAETGAAPRTHRWRYLAAGAIAASLAAVALVELWLPSPDPESALIAELSATTYWTAPSDRWPTTRSTDYLGLPQFDDLNNEPSEVQTWF